MKSVFIILAMAAAVLAAPNTPKPSSDALVSSRLENRIIKSFDFDERKLGNYESMPRFWRQIRENGYPRFLEPCFDYDVGHTAPPSLRFSLAGGNLGAAYLAKDIDIHPNADYQITAWIRPSGLVHARAYVTAYYLDHALRKIEDSERQSAFVRGAGSDEPWVEVTIHLPRGYENARWLGLSCRLEQMSERSVDPDELRPIFYRDIHATAWFDDISVLRLPRLTLQLDAPGNVFLAEQALQCVARVADIDGAELEASLDISDAEGRSIETRPVPVVGLDDPGPRLTMPDLSAGWYHVLLSVRVGEVAALTREQSFIRVSPALAVFDGKRRGFGVIIDPSPALPASVQESLLEALCPGLVKVPLWKRDMPDEAIIKGDPHLDDLLRVLYGRGMTLVGTLEEPPETLARLCGHPKMSLLDVLGSPPDQWRPYLAFIIARYGPQIHAWQIGGEDAPAATGDRRMTTALANVRAELQPLIGPSDLVAPQSLLQQTPAVGAAKADIISFTSPPYVSASGLAGQLATAEGSAPLRRWVTIEPPPDRYARDIRLSELARRIMTARESGVEAVFMRQPWSINANDDAVSVAPNEDFIIYRTVAQALGSLKPDVPIWVDHGVRARLFVDDADQVGAIAVWTDSGQAGSAQAVLDIGTAARRIDMWGNVNDLSAAKGGREFVVETMPAIIAPVSVPRARALAGFAVLEPNFEAVVQEQHRMVVLTNPRTSKLHGELRLQAPAGWRLEPGKIIVDVAPLSQAKIDVAFHIPGNQAAGDYALQARLMIEGDELNGLNLRAPCTSALWAWMSAW
jgi:hypothetical protein